MSNEPMYRKIYEDLYNDIQNGKYGIGDRLPSEKELSEKYGVSRITSKKALEIMADRGYVMRQPGKGTFVLKIPQLQDEFLPDEFEVSGNQTEQTNRPIVGVIMDSFGSAFGPELIRGMEYECRRRGYLMLIRFTYGSVEVETQALNEMLAAGVVGILLVCVQGESYNSDVLKLNLTSFPMILVDRGMQGIPIPVVTTDNYEAGMELANYLIAKGHEKICFVSHSIMQTTTVADRFAGYLNAMASNGLVSDESLWIQDLDSCLPNDEENDVDVEERAIQHLEKYIEERPDVTAFFAVEFEIAHQLIRILTQKGLQDKKAVVYFDGFDTSNILFPNYAYVLQNQYQMGVTAVSMLVHMIRGDAVSAKVTIPYHLVTE